MLEVGRAKHGRMRKMTNKIINGHHSEDKKECEMAFLEVRGSVDKEMKKMAKGSCEITHTDGMKIRMKRQEIGLIVGCSREMVGRAIKVLAHQGDIEVNGKNIVVRGTR